jgi:two-component system NtrC family sensor kinase
MALESVLIVDDDPMVITLCTRILEGEGFETKGVPTGKEAIELFEKESFDLVLLDIKLPDVNGLDILRAAQKLDPETAVIIITGYGTLEIALEASRAGAQGFVLKPVTPEELVVAVHDVLEKKQLIRENLRLRARLPLLEISQVLMSEVNLKRLTDLVLDIVVRETGADRVSLMLLDDEGYLSIISAIGLPEEAAKNTRVKVGEGLAGWTVEKGEPLILTDETDPAPPISEMAQSEIGSAICMPLTLKGLTIGVLNVSRLKGSRSFRQDDVEFLSIMGGQIAIAVENARLYEKLIQAKQEWEDTFDAITDGISIHDRDFNILRANQALAGILNTTPQALIGQKCYQVLHCSQSVPSSCPHLKTMETGEPQVFESQEPHLGNRTFLVSTYPLHDAQGGLTGSVHTIKDITARKQIQAQLIQAEKLSALGRLAASLAHEINNPLQALRSGLALLLNRPLDAEKRQRYIAVANREVERLIGIVERMLDFYRPSPEQREPTDINAILKEVLALAGKKLQHGKVSTQTELAADLPSVGAVASQIQQVFLNLLLNAIESMPDGGRLKITTGLSPDRREALIAFADTGHGITEEEIPKVFEPFYTTKLKGTGLGLAISYGIVERHGGRIEIASEVGQGSTFTVRLPVERGQYE